MRCSSAPHSGFRPTERSTMRFCSLRGPGTVATVPSSAKEKMRSFGFRTALMALLAMVGASVSSVAQADSGTVRNLGDKGRMVHRRIRGKRHAGVSRPAISVGDRRVERRFRVRWVANTFVRPSEPHQQPLGCRRGLRGGWCRCCGRPWSARDCNDQRKRCRLGTHRAAGRIDAERRFEWLGNLAAVTSGGSVAFRSAIAQRQNVRGPRPSVAPPARFGFVAVAAIWQVDGQASFRRSIVKSVPWSPA